MVPSPHLHSQSFHTREHAIPCTGPSDYVLLSYSSTVFPSAFLPVARSFHYCSTVLPARCALLPYHCSTIPSYSSHLPSVLSSPSYSPSVYLSLLSYFLSPLHQVYSPSTDPASPSSMADFDLSRASHSERFRIQQAPPSDLPRRGLGSYLASAPRLRFLDGWAFSARMYSAFRTPARAWRSDEFCKYFEPYLLPVEELRTQASSRC